MRLRHLPPILDDINLPSLIIMKRFSWIRLTLLLAVGVVVSSATSFSNLVHVKSSVDKHNTDCFETAHFQDAILSRGSCLRGCAELHSTFVDVDNDDLYMNTETYNTTATITTKSKLKTSSSQMIVVALLLLFILAFATMEAHQLLLLMTMLLVSGGISFDVVVSFFGAWLVNYLGVLNQTELEDGHDIEKDMYYDCSEEEETPTYSIAWNGKRFKWIEN